jgi:hypothetical protein
LRAILAGLGTRVGQVPKREAFGVGSVTRRNAAFTAAGIAWLGLAVAVLAGVWPSANWDAFAAMMVAGSTALAFAAARASQAASETTTRMTEALAATMRPSLDIGVGVRNLESSGIGEGPLFVRVTNVSDHEARGLVLTRYAPMAATFRSKRGPR